MLVLLEQTVSSMIRTTLLLQMTMSGLAEVNRTCGGTVAGGDASALRLGRSAKIEFDAGRRSLNPNTIFSKTESCCQK